MPLYLKYRPSDFDEIIGNESTVSSIKLILKRKDRPHSYLLTGSSGTGKTTMARIMAKELGASEFDLKEMDSASYRGINTIREMRDNARLSPFSGTCRVWILDEAAELTHAAMPSLLKILEDTPSHVYIILCTTDPQKLLPTIINRCTHFKMESLNDDDMALLIEGIIKDEGKEQLEDDILDRLIEVSNGSSRNALVELDKIIDLEPEEMLDAISGASENDKEIIDLCRALIKKESWKTIAAILKGMKKEPESVRRAVRGYCNAVMLNAKDAKSAARAFLIMNAFHEPFFHNGKDAITEAAYEALNG